MGGTEDDAEEDSEDNQLDIEDIHLSTLLKKKVILSSCLKIKMISYD